MAVFTLFGNDNQFNALINGNVIGNFHFLGQIRSPDLFLHELDLTFFAPILGDTFTLATIATSMGSFNT